MRSGVIARKIGMTRVFDDKRRKSMKDMKKTYPDPGKPS